MVGRSSQNPLHCMFYIHTKLFVDHFGKALNLIRFPVCNSVTVCDSWPANVFVAAIMFLALKSDMTASLILLLYSF